MITVPSQIAAQDKEKPGTSAEFSVGYQESLRYSFFRPKDPETPVKGYNFSAGLLGENNRVEFNFYGNRDLKALELSGRGDIYSIGLIETEALGFYSYHKGSEAVFKDDRISMAGRTIKHSALLSLGGGMGKLNKNNFRIFYLAGAQYVRNDLFITIDQDIINTDNILFTEDVLFVRGMGISGSVFPVRQISIGGIAKYLEAPDTFKGVIPRYQLTVSGEIKIFPLKRFGLSAKGSYTDDPRGISPASKNLAIGALIKI